MGWTLLEILGSRDNNDKEERRLQYGRRKNLPWKETSLFLDPFLRTLFSRLVLVMLECIVCKNRVLNLDYDKREITDINKNSRVINFYRTARLNERWSGQAVPWNTIVASPTDTNTNYRCPITSSRHRKYLSVTLREKHRKTQNCCRFKNFPSSVLDRLWKIVTGGEEYLYPELQNHKFPSHSGQTVRSFLW